MKKIITVIVLILAMIITSLIFSKEAEGAMNFPSMDAMNGPQSFKKVEIIKGTTTTPWKLRSRM